MTATSLTTSLNGQLKDTTTGNNSQASGITANDFQAEKDKLLGQLGPVGIVTGEQLLKDGAEGMDYLVTDLIPRVGMGALAGGSDLGKSCLLRQLSVDISVGAHDWLGFRVKAKFNSALIACTEDDATAVGYMLSKGIDGRDPSILRSLRFLFDYEDLLASVDAALNSQKADLVVVDCFADAFGSDLKDTAKIRSYLHGWQQLATKHECFVIFLHHTSKRTEEREPSKHNLLSGQGFEAKMRLVIELRADLMNPDHRHLCVVKGNYLPSSMKRESHVLLFNEGNLTFSATGERSPFELLVKEVEDGSKAKYKEAKELSDKGYSFDKIAPMIGYSSKGSVSKLFARAVKNGWETAGTAFPEVNGKETAGT